MGDHGERALHAKTLAVLAGHSGDEAEARRLLGDEDPRVRASAFAALVRLGKAGGADVQRAVQDPSATVRRVAAELSGSLPGADFTALLSDVDAAVVEAGCFAVGEQADARAVEALMSIAAEHSDPMCRESAVAALGAIGDQRAVRVVVAALDDRPAVRRRAVIALSAFEGPEVDAALERALGDRDWQTRQAAEDMLGGDGGRRGVTRG